jgi:hypothetical protein
VAVAGLVFALFTVGYILGVWTACLVFRQPQHVYEEGVRWRAADGVNASLSSAHVIVLANASPLAETRR